MAISVTDPIIHVRTSEGIGIVGLHEVLAHAHNGTLLDLCAARADQRAPVVTALAIILHLLRRYASAQLSTPEDWLRALRAQFREQALVLAGGPDKKPQFLNPGVDWFGGNQTLQPTRRPTI